MKQIQDSPPSTLFFKEPSKLGSILVFNSRTREALHARKASDMRLGRPKGKGKSKLDEHSGEINRLIALGVPKTIIAKQYKCSVGNLYNFIKQVE